MISSQEEGEVEREELATKLEASEVETKRTRVQCHEQKLRIVRCGRGEGRGDLKKGSYSFG